MDQQKIHIRESSNEQDSEDRMQFMPIKHPSKSEDKFKMSIGHHKQSSNSTFLALQNTVWKCIPVVLPTPKLKTNKFNVQPLSSVTNSTSFSFSPMTAALNKMKRVSSEENVSIFSNKSTRIKRKVTIEQVRRWETALSHILNDPDGLVLYEQFLKTEFSQENLQFWEACENYRRLPQKLLKLEAQKIYQIYLSVQSPREVNLDSKTRFKTISSMTTPTIHMFDSAQRKIQALMEKDSYQRFLRSSIFLDFKKSVADGRSPPVVPSNDTPSLDRICPMLLNVTTMPLSKTLPHEL